MSISPFREGQVWGFLGPNGSGKTTTIRMLCGLLTPDEGEGDLSGLRHSRTQAEAIKRQVGYMTQKFSFWEDLSIRENLDFVGAAAMSWPIARRRCDRDAWSGLGLVKRQDQLAGHLSGGWKQRLALAACLLHEPQAAAARRAHRRRRPQGAARFLGTRSIALSDEGLTVLVSTHYMDEAERCDRIVYICSTASWSPAARWPK